MTERSDATKYKRRRSISDEVSTCTADESAGLGALSAFYNEARLDVCYGQRAVWLKLELCQCEEWDRVIIRHLYKKKLDIAQIT